jgi:dCTP deaminase
MTVEPHEAHPDIGLDVLHHVADVKRAIGVGQSGRDEQGTRHGGDDWRGSKAGAESDFNSGGKSGRAVVAWDRQSDAQQRLCFTVFLPTIPALFSCGRPDMSIKSDRWIRRMAQEQQMIEPFEPAQVRYSGEHKIVSYGTSSYGYDIRCANEFKIFTNINSTIVDPKNFDERSFVDFVGDVCIIPPNSFALARTVEYFRIPRSVLTVCLGKSTYARCGIIVNVTPFEPEWEGYVTLEFSNTTPLPAKIYANEGVAQVLFFESDEVCEVSYKDRGGKYQGQRGVTLPKG